MKEALSQVDMEVTASPYFTENIPEQRLCELENGNPETRELPSWGTQRLDGVVIGILVGFEDSGAPLVDFTPKAAGQCLPARSVVPLNLNEVGREVALMFETGDAQKPIIMGLMQDPLAINGKGPNPLGHEQPNAIAVEVDGERLVLTATREIVLRCGKASITLTQAGKILIRGEYLLSRSSGVNRIKGGSVQIN